ncbi:class II aldolase/adducin domain-containing protein [Pseudovirgaria hyperparasitica]|uniref:Class II aldolase/adducin domain-containing protein n=1 Tax=Pseudovirgaria hyperparasitica TaxID=470096 RepID=A0A6A6W6A7_9PEZI|nr:class II aldolase/adducin domain-containing protein [Pseudovirgaria hyperparasitica]KAF2758412.1 class II aldolase/adducin domain-containing protein [Pseudovirgaria hyperparasitica]
MSPPSAIVPEYNGNGHNDAPAAATHEPGLSVGKVKEKVNAGMKFPGPPKFSDPYEERKYLKQRLAAAFRIFAKYGFDEGVAGHITLRDPVEPDKFWVNPFGVHFALIKASDLILVNEDGKVVDGGEVRLLNTAAFMIHSAIHQARPDVNAACHSHSIYGRTFCTLGRTIETTSQDACAFYNDLALYESFNGIVLAEEEGKNIAKCLGQKKAALLQNHGLLTAGETVEEAVFWFCSLEKLCHTQLLADAAAAGRGGKPIEIDEEDAKYTHKVVGSKQAGWFSGKPLFDLIHKETGGDYME